MSAVVKAVCFLLSPGIDPTMDNDFRQLWERSTVMDFQPMSPEEMQRTMQFLLDQQARFDTQIERLSGKVDRMADGLIGLTGTVGRLATTVDHFAEEHDRQLREARGQLEAADAIFAATSAISNPISTW